VQGGAVTSCQELRTGKTGALVTSRNSFTCNDRPRSDTRRPVACFLLGDMTTRARDSGFSLVEVLVAAALLATALLAAAELLTHSVRTGVGVKSSTYAAVLAGRKVEELRALTLAFDQNGLPVTDLTTNTAVTPEAAVGGTGLTPSPDGTLTENTPGYVDYVDEFGRKVGGGVRTPAAVYTRRWSIAPLPSDPVNTLIIQVSVLRTRDDGPVGAGRRQPEEARLVTSKTRRAP